MSTRPARPTIPRLVTKERFEPWSAQLKFSRGRWAGLPFKPPPWSIEALKRLQDDVDERGYRNTRMMGFGMPKKTGKTELAAMIGIWGLCGCGENSPEVYLLAATKGQAEDTLFRAVRIMAQGIGKEVVIAIKGMEIRCPRNNGVLKVVSTEMIGKQGISPSMVICDEVHEWRDEAHREAWEIMTSPEASVARDEPLVIWMSMAGRKREGVGWELWSHALRVQNGQVEDRRLIPVIHAAPEDADWTDPEVAFACNPMLDITISRAHIIEGIKKAKRSRREEISYRQWRIAQWVELGEAPWLTLPGWDRCNGPVGEPPPGVATAGGLDASNLRDLSALAIVWRQNGRTHVKAHVWLPEGAVDGGDNWERPEWERRLVHEWIEQGYLKLLPGEVMNFDRLEEEVVALLPEDCWLGLDSYGLAQMYQHFQDREIEVRKVWQNPRGMTTGTTELERLVVEGELNHGGHPILRHGISVTCLKQDPSGYVQPDKSRAKSRIDPVVASIMALDGLLKRPADDPEVERETWHHFRTARPVTAAAPSRW